jgi:small subunit ribosomal protein S17e
MGRVRTKTVKRAAKVLLEKHYQKLTNDFHINKRILSEVAKVPTKRLRNKIAGFATHLVKRIQRGPVKGISLKVQEEERERRLDWVPKQSEIQTEKVTIDNETSQMLKSRFGEDFFNQVQGNLEIRVQEQQRRTQRVDKRKGGKDNRERKPRP